MRPVLILAIFLINFTGLKGQTTEISEMTDEGISAKGMEWRQHGNANTHEFKDTMEVTRRSFWQSITRKFQEWESTSMSYLEKDRSISPEDTTNISINMMDNARGITRKFQEWVTASMLRLQMNQSEEFDLTTHFPNDMVEKAQDSGKIEPEMFNHGQIQAGHIWKVMSPLKKCLWTADIAEAQEQQLMATIIR